MSDTGAIKESLIRDAIVPGSDQNVAKIDRYMTDTLNRVDAKNRDAKPVKSESKDDSIIAKEYERRTGQEFRGDAEFARESHAIAPPIIGASSMSQIERAQELTGRKRLAARMRWIKSKPELYAKAKGFAAGLQARNPNVRKRSEVGLRQLIEMTNRLVGYDWRNPPGWAQDE